MGSSWLPLYALASHAAGDFPLQSDDMAARKFDSPFARAKHVAAYTAAFVPTVLASEWGRADTARFLAALTASHFAIDSRRWVEPKTGFETFPVWYDQALHLVALAAAVAFAEGIDGQ